MIHLVCGSTGAGKPGRPDWQWIDAWVTRCEHQIVAIARFALACAGQTERNHVTLVKAQRSGRIMAITR